MQARPPMIRTNSSNAFAHNTMKVRVPRTIRAVQEMNPDYPRPIQTALDKLHDDIEGNAPVQMIDFPAPDYDDWAAMRSNYHWATWLNTTWFFAETFFYRHLIQAVRWWETARDPFAPTKAEELASAALWNTLEAALSIRGASSSERLHMLIHRALWGNRIDLSYPMSLEHGSTVEHSDLLADDSEKTVKHLLKSLGDVHIIADNTGTELALDLALAEALLDSSAKRVVLHLKMHPTFVSDATISDLHALIEAMQASTKTSVIAFADRIKAALEGGQLRLAPDFYWNSSSLFWDLPPRLTRSFSHAILVIAKGDLNYRRIMGDARWEANTDFTAVTDYFEPPLLALRTLKSDPIVGLPGGKAEALDAEDSEWRFNGKRGVIQFKDAKRP